MRRKVDELQKIYSELLAADLEQACVGMWADVFCRRLICDSEPEEGLCAYLQSVLRGMWRLMERLVADGEAAGATEDDAVLAGAAERVRGGVLGWFARDYARHERRYEVDGADETARDDLAARKAIFADAIGDAWVGRMEQWLNDARDAARQHVGAAS